MRYREHQFNTTEQVEAYLAEALGVVERLAPPTDLRVPCFQKAAELLAGKQVFFEQPQAVALDPRLLRH